MVSSQSKHNRIVRVLYDYITVFMYQIAFGQAKVNDASFAFANFFVCCYILDSRLHHYQEGTHKCSMFIAQLHFMLDVYQDIKLHVPFCFSLPAGIDRSRPIDSIYDIYVHLDQEFYPPQDVLRQTLCVSRTHWEWYTSNGSNRTCLIRPQECLWNECSRWDYPHIVWPKL